MDSRPELDELLAHAGWARALARSLVRDPNAADDLVQRAWLAALEERPASGLPLRAWLAGVLRNLVRVDRRAHARRVAREALAARPEGVQHAFDDEFALQRRLADAVRALDEPQRSTVWARYYEGLPPR